MGRRDRLSPAWPDRVLRPSPSQLADLPAHGRWGCRALTQGLRLGAAPEPVGQALVHRCAHQGVACVAGEDGHGPVHRQRPDLIAIGGRGQASARDDYETKE